jgi:tRNA pseudouridine38-40 synthase
MANPIQEWNSAPEGARRFRLTLAYDGTDFVGSQWQAAGRTVQGELERAVSELHGTRVAVELAGRTDSGVHALGMVAAYDAQTRLRAETVCRALNARLPRDVRVLRCEEAAQGFDPRFDAKSKRYRYRLWVAEEAHPLVRRTVWHIRPPLEAERMREACRMLEGERDFGAFRSTGSGSGSAVRTLTLVRLRQSGRLWRLEFEGKGFLRHQVRAMVGTLVEVGRGRMDLSEFAAALGSGRRELAGPTAPARGLVLVRVRY